MFHDDNSGRLVDIAGTDPESGPWHHKAFVPAPPPHVSPELSGRTYRAVADARAAVAALDSTARQLPNPQLLRTPTLRKEAQATSALEGTYAPLQQVMTADPNDPLSGELHEVLNYVDAADGAFTWLAEGRELSVGLLADLQGTLMRGTPLEGESGALRESQVVIGHRDDAPKNGPLIRQARFVPAPPGDQLRAGVDELMRWMRVGHDDEFDPVVAAAVAHYQFETLHPFRDGNGRIGRLLIVLHLLSMGVLSEPTLTVSPWFEARRQEYYDALLHVSTDGAWDDYTRFFARGIQGAAETTRDQMIRLVQVQERLKDAVRRSSLRADTALLLVDHAVAQPTFTVRSVEHSLGISYVRANKVVEQLIELGILQPLDDRAYNRRFVSPAIMRVLLDEA